MKARVRMKTIQYGKNQFKMKKVLLKDVVIKAGTVFQEAPCKTTRDDTHYDCVIGLSDNTCGFFTYCIDPGFPGELDEYFADLKE